MEVWFNQETRQLHFLHTIGLRGFVKLEGVNIYTGRRRLIADWFPNKILDAGRNVMATRGDWLNYAQVGNGSTEPTASDTSLEQYVTGTNDIVVEQYSAQNSSPYYGYKRRTYRFPVGTATGNLQEAGVGWGTSGATLTSRALIVDGNGDPTTATVLSNEFLDLTYELRYYPPLTDVTGVITFDRDYNYIIRAAEVTSSDAWGRYIGSQIGYQNADSPDKRWRGYDGTLGTLEQTPNGTTENFSGLISNGTYVNNSYKIGMTAQADSAGWVFDPPNLRSIRICTTAGHYQMQFTAQSGDPEVPKAIGISMGVSFELAWQETAI